MSSIAPDLKDALKIATNGRISEDLVAELRGWELFSQALVNAAQSASASQLIPMMLELRRIGEERNTDVAEAEHKIGLLLDQADLEQGKQAEQDVRISLLDIGATAALLAFAVAQSEIIVLRSRIKVLEESRDANFGREIEALQKVRDEEASARATSEGEADVSTK